MSQLTHNPLSSPISSSEKRGKGRPKGSRNKLNVVATKFGTAIEGLNSTQRKALDQLLFSATEPSALGTIPNSILANRDHLSQGRSIPRNDVKTNHLLLKSITVAKNMTTGAWEVSHVETNQGQFGTGDQQTEKINQSLVISFVAYIKKIFEADLIKYIEDER